MDYVALAKNPNILEWQKKELDRIADQLRHTITESGGILRWSESGNIPPKEYLLYADYLRLPFQMKRTLEAREVEEQFAIEQYKENRKNMTAEDLEEERLEARAAHGPGVTLVNVLTGEKYTT